MLLRTICGLSLLVSCLIVWLCSCSLWILPLLFLGCFLGLLLTAFLVLWIFSAVVDMKVPQERDSNRRSLFLLKRVSPMEFWQPWATDSWQ